MTKLIGQNYTTPDLVAKVTGQAKYAAALLAGELPTNIEDLFAPAGLALFPASASDLSCSCECDVFTGKPHDFGPGDPSVAATRTRFAAACASGVGRMPMVAPPPTT